LIIKRFFPTRWARISAWTGAAVAWVTVAIAVGSASATDEAAPEEPILPEPVEETPVVTTTTAVVPVQPAEGLVVLRFTPVPPPPPEVIVQTVVVAGTPRPATAAPAPTKPPVKSKGS